MSLNSGKYRPGILVNTLLFSQFDIRHGALSRLLNELGSTMSCEASIFLGDPDAASERTVWSSFTHQENKSVQYIPP